MAACRRSHHKDMPGINIINVCMGAHIQNCQGKIHLGQRIAMRAETVTENKSFVASVPFHPLRQFNSFPVSGMCHVSAARAENHGRAALLFVFFQRDCC